MKNILKKIFTLKNLFLVLGFTFMYIVPIILFGEVVPYTHDTLDAGLTKAGYIAVAIMVIIICKKVKERILALPKCLIRGLVLSIFPIMYWVIATVGIHWLLALLTAISRYVDRLIIFIIIGRLFYTAEETIVASERKE
jgi:hypothetical protein